jgi:membrane fusion protein (multidrug efflux system)
MSTSPSTKLLEPRLRPTVDRAEPRGQPEPPPPSVATPPVSRSGRRVRLVALLLLLAAATAGGRMWWHGHLYVSTENAYATGHVNPVSTRVAGVVTRVAVEDNQVVQAGDLIAELDPVDQRLRMEQIEAQVRSVEQQMAQADAQIAQAKAQAGAASAQSLQSAAQVRRAELDAARYADLHGAQMKAVSRAEVDATEAALAVARADLAGRRDAVQGAQAQIGAALASRGVLQAQVEVLKLQLKEAQQQFAYHRITAPVAGRVGKRAVELGQRVQPGQALAAIVQNGLWITANFKETQLADLRPGLPARVVFDALPDRPLEGRIDSFAPASGAQFALLPTENATGNFTKIVQRVPVKVLLRPEDLRALGGALVPGMSALVEVRRPS